MGEISSVAALPFSELDFARPSVCAIRVYASVSVSVVTMRVMRDDKEAKLPTSTLAAPVAASVVAVVVWRGKS